MIPIQVRRLLGMGLLSAAGILSACESGADVNATASDYELWTTRDGLLFGHLDHPDYAFGPIGATDGTAFGMIRNAFHHSQQDSIADALRFSSF